MKFQQEKPEFKPITIVLETREEANGLLEIVDVFGAHDVGLNISRDAREVGAIISNAFTAQEVEI